MKRNLIGLFLLLLIIKEAPAQKATDFTVTHYTNENGLPQNSARGLEMDRNGFLWIATESGLLRFDGQRFRLCDRDHFPILVYNRISFLELSTDSLICFKDGGEQGYAFDKDYKLQAISEKVYKKKIGAFETDRYKFWSDTLTYISRERNVWSMSIFDYDGRIKDKYGQLNNKFYYWDNQGKIRSVNSKGQKSKVKLKGILPGLIAPVSSFGHRYGFYKHGSNLYLLVGRGIYQLHESGINELTASLVLEGDMMDISVYRNYPELDLQVVGTWTHGLFLYRRKQFKTYKHTNGFGNFYAQVPFGDSGVLTDKGLVYPSFSRYNFPFEILETFRSLLKDSRGHYWMNRGGKTIHPIIELDKELKVVRKYNTVHEANCFRETPDGRIWMSSFRGEHLGYIHQDSVRWLKITWSGRSIFTFLPENNEIFWIAGDKTLAKLNVKTGQQTHYKVLEKFTIESLYLDTNKVLWIGTSGNGFFALNGNKIYKLPWDTRAALKNVHAFLEDKRGYMWMSTNNGLFRCKKEDLNSFIDNKTATVYYQFFGKESGFNTNEFNGTCTPSAIVLGNSKFSFPSMDGLVQFYPDSIREVLPEAKIFIDRLLVDGNEQDLSQSPALEPSFEYLEIEVSSPFFGNSSNQQIEYNVKGLNRNWYPVKSDNIVTLNNLPYGKYSLQFRKRAGFSSNIITTALPFTVLPFFYQTWYFRLAVLVLVLIIIFVLVRIRYANLMKRNRVLEQEVSQRTLHLQNANRLKEKMLMMVGHDLQSPLHFLRLLSDNIAEALKQQQLEQVHNGTEEIRNTAGRMHAFVEEFSMWTRLQDENLNISKRPFSLSDLMEELSQFFEGMLLQHDNRLKLDIEAPYELYTNRELLKAILRNIIDNANKHTRKGLIHIRCYKERAGVLGISISDTGKGMSSIELNNIRRRIAQVEGAFNTGHTSKLGYQLIVDFVQRLSAGITIDSEKDKGTTVIIHGVEIHSSDNPGSVLLSGKTIGSSELH
jgi:signal transduction histidine kinase